MTILIVIFYMSITVNSVASVTMQEFGSVEKCEIARAFINKAIGHKSLSVYAACVQK